MRLKVLNTTSSIIIILSSACLGFDANLASIYNAMISLFMIMTSGWSEPIRELRAFENAPNFVTNAYTISFFIFFVLITLNIFLAVMTSQIQERIKYGMNFIKKKKIKFKKNYIHLKKMY